MTEHLRKPSLNSNILSKSSSSNSCENLLCLTRRCYEEDIRQKYKILNSQYFEKLSLKKFNQSVMINQSLEEKARRNEKIIRRDKSTENSLFENMVHDQRPRQTIKYSIGINKQINVPELQNLDDTHRRLSRSLSYQQFNRPQLKSTDRTLKRQLQQDFQKLQSLSKLRSRLQQQINELDQNIDKYYLVYNLKLEELKNIQQSMRELESEEQNERVLYKVPSTDELNKFKKKKYTGHAEGIKQVASTNSLFKNIPTIQVKSLNSGQVVLFQPKSSPKSYNPNINISFLKKSS